jgi:protein-L-isoaspartate O-methyltransferase
LIPDKFNTEIFEFIKANESSDAFELTLRSHQFSPDIRKLISEQVLSRQKLRKKVPSWGVFDKIILPKPESIEQASSEITAVYKSELIRGGRLLDLTGGSGVDTYFFSKKASHVDYVEKDADLAAIAGYNFSYMGLRNVNVINQNAEEFLRNAQQTFNYDTVYIDPSRRNLSDKVFKLEDSEPDILNLQSQLNDLSRLLIIKASPFLDIKYAFRQVKHLRAVHILAVDNECKEILLIRDTSQAEKDIHLTTINFSKGEMQKYDSSMLKEQERKAEISGAGSFLYDPNAAIRKAGLFNSIARDFNLTKLSGNSHLYFSDTLSQRFPGRIFELIDRIPFHKFLKKPMYEKANIAIRNFPLTVSQIRKRTGIKEGGDIYVFGTTDHRKNTFFILAKRIK